MYIIVLFAISFILGFLSGVAVILIYRKANEKRKCRKKYSFNNNLQMQKPISNVSDYTHNQEEHSYQDF